MQQEEKDLLQALYERYQGILRLIAIRDEVPECEIDDIVQETFCSFMRVYGKQALDWNERQRKAVLMRILKNRCIDYFRRIKRKDEVSMDEEDPMMEYSLLRYQVRRDICDGLIQQEKIRKIHECILGMKPKLSQVAILYIVEGRPLEEVCKILNISSPTCRMRISRVRKYLREELIKMDQFP